MSAGKTATPPARMRRSNAVAPVMPRAAVTAAGRPRTRSMPARSRNDVDAGEPRLAQQRRRPRAACARADLQRRPRAPPSRPPRAPAGGSRRARPGRRAARAPARSARSPARAARRPPRRAGSRRPRRAGRARRRAGRRGAKLDVEPEPRARSRARRRARPRSTSVATTREVGPLVLERERDRRPSRCRRRRRARPRGRSSTASTRCSVSGRGISTRGSTASSMSRKPLRAEDVGDRLALAPARRAAP